MSRCFPYPPPGYAGKCASNEALIWTIKLQRESEKTKSDKKKDRRREKKEKKREDKSSGTIPREKKILTDEKLFHAGKYGKYPEVCSEVKQQESSYEHMEKSSLTEEHGKPCCSSDSTENSGKRKRESPPHASNNTRNTGTVIRFVMNARKKEGCPTTTTSSENASLSLTTGRVDSLYQKADIGVKNSASNIRISPLKSNATQQNVRIAPPKSSAAQQNIRISPPKSNATQQYVRISPPKSNATQQNVRISPPKSNTTQQLLISSNKEQLLCPGKRIDQGSSSKDEKKLPRPLRKYQALFENFVVPPSMEFESVDDDEDWLFGSKKEVCEPAKRMKCCKEEVSNCGMLPALQPQAHFLSDVDIYALPFTVPF